MVIDPASHRTCPRLKRVQNGTRHPDACKQRAVDEEGAEPFDAAKAVVPQAALLMPSIEALAQEGSDGEEWIAKDRKDKATGDEADAASTAGLAPTPVSRDGASGEAKPEELPADRSQ